MDIYFADITFNESPLIWKYDPTAHTAECLCVIQKTDGFFTREDVLRELKQKNYFGIEVLAETALINDIPEFIKNHPMCIFVPMLDLANMNQRTTAKITHDGNLTRRHLTRAVSTAPPVAHVSYPSSVKSTTSSRALTAESPQHSDAAAPSAATKAATADYSLFAGTTPRTGSNSSLFSPTPFKNIKLHRLISRRKDPGLWGDTRSYLDYFTEKTEEDRALRLPSCLRDEFSFHKAIQYEINDRICPIKAEQMKLIKQILDELDPFYQQWKNDNKPVAFILKSFAKYLKSAVLHSMSNTAFNHEPTEFELLSNEQRQQKFHDNQALYLFANREARTVRARLMLMDWLVLFDASLSFEPSVINALLVGEDKKRIEQFTAHLTNFRTFLLQDSTNLIYINPLIQNLINLLIRSGEMEYRNQQATDNLNLQLKQHLDIHLPSDKTAYYSLYLAVEHCLKIMPTNKHASVKKQMGLGFPVNGFTTQVIARVVHLLHGDKELQTERYTPIIVRPLNTCSNLYLVKNWMMTINKHLETIDWGQVIKHSEGHKLVKNIEEVGDIIFRVIKEKSQLIVEPSLPEGIKHTASSSMP